MRKHRSLSTDTLEIQNLHASVEGKKILNGIHLTIRSGEIHALMGTNGSGKSTLCHVLMGHPKYTVTRGKALFNGKNILKLSPDARAHLGLFLGFQNPAEVAGVSFGNFLRFAKNANTKEKRRPQEFLQELGKTLSDLGMEESFSDRAVNEGFSGGEKKRAEIVQMNILEPKMVILDEIDSGLDIDALRIVAQKIKEYKEKSNAGMLLITHYQRILNFVEPDYVHVIRDGKIVKSGGRKLAEELEEKGYDIVTPQKEKR